MGPNFGTSEADRLGGTKRENSVKRRLVPIAATLALLVFATGVAMHDPGVGFRLGTNDTVAMPQTSSVDEGMAEREGGATTPEEEMDDSRRRSSSEQKSTDPEPTPTLTIEQEMSDLRAAHVPSPQRSLRETYAKGYERLTPYD